MPSTLLLAKESDDSANISVGQLARYASASLAPVASSVAKAESRVMLPGIKAYFAGDRLPMDTKAEYPKELKLIAGIHFLLGWHYEIRRAIEVIDWTLFDQLWSASLSQTITILKAPTDNTLILESMKFAEQCWKEAGHRQIGLQSGQLSFPPLTYPRKFSTNVWFSRPKPFCSGEWLESAHRSKLQNNKNSGGLKTFGFNIIEIRLPLQ